MATTPVSTAIDTIMYERDPAIDGVRSTPMFRSSAMAVPYVNKTANYTVTYIDEYIFVDATAGVVTITLPTAVPQMTSGGGQNGQYGRRYYVVKIDASANAVTVATTSAQTINGSATASLAAQYNRIGVMSNGTNWIQVS